MVEVLHRDTVNMQIGNKLKSYKRCYKYNKEILKL